MYFNFREFSGIWALVKKIVNIFFLCSRKKKIPALDFFLRRDLIEDININNIPKGILKFKKKYGLIFTLYIFFLLVTKYQKFDLSFIQNR